MVWIARALALFAAAAAALAAPACGPEPAPDGGETGETETAGDPSTDPDPGGDPDADIDYGVLVCPLFCKHLDACGLTPPDFGCLTPCKLSFQFIPEECELLTATYFFCLLQTDCRELFRGDACVEEAEAYAECVGGYEPGPEPGPPPP